MVRRNKPNVYENYVQNIYPVHNSKYNWPPFRELFRSSSILMLRIPVNFRIHQCRKVMILKYYIIYELNFFFLYILSREIQAIGKWVLFFWWWWFVWRDGCVSDYDGLFIHNLLFFGYRGWVGEVSLIAEKR